MPTKIKQFFFQHPFLFVIVGTLVLYYPAIHVPFRDPDQLVYFANLGSHSLWEGLRHFDYAVSRLYWKGDDLLFRPLLFVLLAFENYFFSYHYSFWNLTNVCLHIGVLAVFYRLLLTLNPDKLFAGLFTALFAFSKAPLGLVDNPHLSGYLAGFICFFAALEPLYRVTKSDNIGLLWCFSVLSAGAVFFYDLTLPFLLLAVLLVIVTQKISSPKYYFWLALPFLLYFAFYTIHAVQAKRIFYTSSLETPSMLALENIRLFPERTVYMLRQFVRDVLPDSRLVKVIFGILFLGVLAPAFSKSKLLLASYPWLVLAAYVGIVAFYRATFFRDYYQYFFYLVFVLGMYALLDFSKLNRIQSRLVLLFLTLTISLNAWQVLSRHISLRNDYASLNKYFDTLNQFVDAHLKEPGFSFRIQDPDKDFETPSELKAGYPDGSEEVITKNASEILYAPYYDKMSPVYELRWNQNQFLIEFNKSRQAS